MQWESALHDRDRSGVVGQRDPGRRAPRHAAAEQGNHGEGIAEHEGKAHRQGNGLQVSPSEDLADGTAARQCKVAQNASRFSSPGRVAACRPCW